MSGQKMMLGHPNVNGLLFSQELVFLKLTFFSHPLKPLPLSAVVEL